jgi:hypothetical protein
MSAEKNKQLINLDSQSSQVILMKNRAVASADIKKITEHGYVIAFVASLLISIFVIFFAFQYPDNDPLAYHFWFWQILVISIAISFPVCAFFRRRYFYREVRKGFLRLDLEELQYWNPGGVKTIPMERLFGAAEDPEVPDLGLRLCYLAQNKQGYETVVRNFENYEIVEGTFKNDLPSDANGNQVAAKAILNVINIRRAAGKPVAEMPPFPFESISYHHKHLIAGKHTIVNSFKCDGKNVEITIKTDSYVMPATTIKGIDVHQRQIKNNPTEWKIDLILDPTDIRKFLRLDILDMSNREELDEYLHCLPTMFASQND